MANKLQNDAEYYLRDYSITSMKFLFNANFYKNKNIQHLNKYYLQRYIDESISNTISKIDYVNFKYSNLMYFIMNEHILESNSKKFGFMTSKFLCKNYYTNILNNKHLLKKLYDNDGYFTSTIIFYGSSDNIFSCKDIVIQSITAVKKTIIKIYISLKAEYNIKELILSKLTETEQSLFKVFASKRNNHIHEASKIDVAFDNTNFNLGFMKEYNISIIVIQYYDKLIEELQKFQETEDDYYNKHKVTAYKNALDNIVEHYIGIGLWWEYMGQTIVYTLTHILTFNENPTEIDFNFINYNEMLKPFMNQTQHFNYKNLVNINTNQIFIPIFSYGIFKKFNKIRKNLCLQNDYTMQHSSINKDLLVDEITTNIKNKKKHKKNKKKSIIELSPTSTNDIIEIQETDSIDSTNSSDDEIEIAIELEKIKQATIIEDSENQHSLILKKNHYDISFNYYEYFENKHYIRFLINDCYNTNDKFTEFMGDYTHIRVKKDIHTDLNGLEKSLHFNLVFYNQDFNEISKQYHAYIFNNSITSMTRIEAIF